MLLEALEKAVRIEECALCEITYTPIGKRRAWVRCAQRLGVIVDELHRDELPAEWGLARTELPCVLARVGAETPAVLLAREQIAECRGRVEQLETRLLDALDGPVRGDEIATPAR